MIEAAAPAGTITQASSCPPGKRGRRGSSEAPAAYAPTQPRSWQRRPKALPSGNPTGCALSCIAQVANHRKAIGLRYAGVQTAANAGVQQYSCDMPVVSVPQAGWKGLSHLILETDDKEKNENLAELEPRYGIEP